LRLLEDLTMPMTVDSLRGGISAVAAHLETTHAMLSELDGKVGDGDLGITLLKAFRELDQIAKDLPADLGPAFMMMAGAVTKVSSSSFGTLLATSLMSAAKATRGETSIEWERIPALMTGAREAMSARGKANLGDKTVLDALAGAAQAGTGVTDPGRLAAAASAGISAALDAFRDKPSKVGRARIFAEKTVGLDDPGMIALREMVAALSATA
jgi:phosphoenolpyruvate---glycerone phosphotransferase subunit DhaL